MHGPDLHLRPADRDNTLLVVLIALLALPLLGIAWVWLARANYDIGRAFERTLGQMDDDPLLLAIVADFFLLVATGAALLWGDARRRGIGAAGRTAWVVAFVLLGTLGLWMYLAARPPLRPPG
jgi:hypothetical protein